MAMKRTKRKITVEFVNPGALPKANINFTNALIEIFLKEGINPKEIVES